MKSVKEMHHYLTSQSKNKIAPTNQLLKNNWKGGAIDEEHNWNCAANWSLQRIPSKTDIVIIPGGQDLSEHAPQIQTHVGQIVQLIIENGAELHLSATGSLVIQGNQQDDNALFISGGRLISEGCIELIDPGQKGIEIIDGYFMNKGVIRIPTLEEEPVLANHQSIFINRGSIELVEQKGT